MYGRDYAGNTLNFEASGGLTNASLVMQDQQTDTYWSLMKGKALEGKLKGQTLNELSTGEKVRWGVWKKKHPSTKVLSVDGMEDGRNPYLAYFANDDGFHGLKAKDKRLETKSPVFAFHVGDQAFAIDHADAVSGATFELSDGRQLFLYRKSNDAIFRSTSVFASTEGFVRERQGWVDRASGARFSVKLRNFVSRADSPPPAPAKSAIRLGGFDTYWYNWSLNNPGTEILRPLKQ